MVVLVTNLLEKQRGAIQSSSGPTAKILFSFVKKYLQAWIFLLEVYKSHHDVVVLIFRLFKDTARFQLDWLEGEDSDVFMTACISLFHKVEHCGLAKMSSTVNIRLQDQYEVEICDQILTLLKLANTISERRAPKTAEAIYHGLKVIIPRINPQVLQVRPPHMCDILLGHRVSDLVRV